MQKEDIQWAVLGILILLVIALVIKPVATGEPVNTGLPIATPTATIKPPATAPTSVITAHPVTITTTATPTPTQTWNGSTYTIQFVDPSTYGVVQNTSSPSHSNIPQSDLNRNWTNMSVYAHFEDLGWTDSNGIHPTKSIATTQTIFMRYPYWELWYRVDPLTSDLRKQAESSGIYVITPTQGKGVSMSGYAGSYSTAMPALSIQVMDAEDPNRIVRTISPPGGIDPVIWTQDATTASGDTIKAYDPRPWKEKFYEGQRSYYFVVKAALLKSYRIDIMIPNSYLGKY
jgi:hypothetical protein